MKLNKIRGIIFDWAGTTVDYGCRAPLAVFLDIFRKKGLEITVEEASKPMGMLKIEHIRELFKMERIRKQYQLKFNKDPDEHTINEFYADFEPALFKILPNYAEPLPDVVETVHKLRKSGLKIGSTTGYTREMMDILTPIAEKNHYKPDYMISSSEVRQGRPHPWMMFDNAYKLGISPMENLVKFGDTIADIQEGTNAGTWSVGIVEGSSLLGYTHQEYEAADKEEIRRKKIETINIFNENKADFVINSFKEIPQLIEQINERLSQGLRPGGNMQFPQQPYRLFTPGPITTSIPVKMAMMTDWGSRETDYLDLVQRIRSELVKVALLNNKNSNLHENYTTVIMQGSGTFGVESCVGSAVPKDGKLLVIINGNYGNRMSQISRTLGINTIDLEFKENEIPCVKKIEEVLQNNKDITHVGYIHSETTTGILNPLVAINAVIKKYDKISICDAMSSFGAVALDVHDSNIDFLVSSSNKNVQGVPGFCFVIANKKQLEKCKHNSPRSVSLDLYDQWVYLEKNKGGFRYTSPVHALKAFDVALNELEKEGGVHARFKRYTLMQNTLSEGMKKLNFRPLDLGTNQGPIITTFFSPKTKEYNFMEFYQRLKDRKCVIYPGKLTKEDTFRIGTMGHLFVEDVEFLLEQVRESMFWENKH